MQLYPSARVDLKKKSNFAMRKPAKKDKSADSTPRTSKLTQAIIASSEDVAPDLKSCFEELVTNSLKKHKNLGPNDLLVQVERKLPDEIAQDDEHLQSLIEISAAAKSKDKRDPFLTNLQVCIIAKTQI